MSKIVWEKDRGWETRRIWAGREKGRKWEF
jgi:hypothetical protein